MMSTAFGIKVFEKYEHVTIVILSSSPMLIWHTARAAENVRLVCVIDNNNIIKLLWILIKPS